MELEILVLPDLNPVGTQECDEEIDGGGVCPNFSCPCFCIIFNPNRYLY